MDKQHRSYSDDEEHGYISQKTGIDTKLIEEIPNEDFADMVVCKLCETEFIRT